MKPQAQIKGQPLSLHVLDYGMFRVHSGPRDIGICGYLITTDADERILMDTGFPAKYARDPKAATQQDRLFEFGEVLLCTPDHLPAAQLARAGVALDQITHMVQSHTHIDHIGGLALCPKAPMFIAATERALERPLYWGDVQPLSWPDRRYIEVDADCEIGPGLRLFLVPGHAPGQLALMVDLPKTGPVLLTSDAISRPGEIAEAFAGSWDEPAARASAERLMQAAQSASATVIYGHCPEQWPMLKKAPAFYD